MFILYILLLIVLFIPFPEIRLCANSSAYHEDYLSINSTLPIKGFFVVLVFFRHSLDYIKLGGTLLDRTFINIDYYSSQLIVAAFLFYSGYGIYESIKKKGMQYIKSFPLYRLFRTWFCFAICVSLFLVFDIATNDIYPLKTIMLSYTGWESIGNSNWYMFDIFALYIIVFISFRFFSQKESALPLLIFSFLSVLLICFLVLRAPGPWWYNTILCFVYGMWYSRYKSNIEKIVLKNNTTYYLTLLSSIVVFLILYFISFCFTHYILIFAVPVFVLIIIFLSMKIKLRSTLLSYLGKHVFSIYILQRLAFLILKNAFSNEYLYFAVSFVFTIVISFLFDIAINIIEKGLYKARNYSKPI